jgi:hypothetical protein
MSVIWVFVLVPAAMVILGWANSRAGLDGR